MLIAGMSLREQERGRKSRRCLQGHTVKQRSNSAFLSEEFAGDVQHSQMLVMRHVSSDPDIERPDRVSRCRADDPRYPFGVTLQSAPHPFVQPGSERADNREGALHTATGRFVLFTAVNDSPLALGLPTIPNTAFLNVNDIPGRSVHARYGLRNGGFTCLIPLRSVPRTSVDLIESRKHQNANCLPLDGRNVQ